MEDYSIIQGPTLFEAVGVLLSIFIVSYVYLSWKIRAGRAAVPKHSANMPNLLVPKAMPPNNSPAPKHVFNGSRLWWKKHNSFLENWLAPILVWAAVLWTTLAVIAILLGET